MIDATDFSEEAIARAEESAREWFEYNDLGAPRSWFCESQETRFLDDYEEAPVIAGYEIFERLGYIERGQSFSDSGQERVLFSITEAGIQALRRNTT